MHNTVFIWPISAAQDAADQMKTVYQKTSKLWNDFPKKIGKNGNLLTDEHKIRNRWNEHFTEVLNSRVGKSYDFFLNKIKKNNNNLHQIFLHFLFKSIFLIFKNC